MPPFVCIACDAGPSGGIWSRSARVATASASRRDGVSRMARASGSCSACAIRSAAIHAGRPDDDTTTISLGPAWKSIAQSARDERLCGGDIRVARSDDLVDGRNRLGAVGERRDGVRAAEPEQPRDAGHAGGVHDRGVRARAHRDDLFARRPPAREWRSSAATTGADNGRRGRSSRRDPAAARAG